MSAPSITTFKKRDVIFAAGDAGGALPKLIKGAAILYTLFEDGRRQVLDLAGPGDVLHFEVDGAIDFYAEALTACEVACYDAAELLSSSDGTTFVMEQMRERLAIERRHVTMLSEKSAAERLTDFIHLSAECLGQDETCFELPLTRQQIADFTGLTLETVSRTFAQWERDKVLTKVAARTYRLGEGLAA